MTSTTLSQKQLNFARFSIVCVDIIKLPLIDILNIYIKPANLDKQIKSSKSLLDGKYKLNPDQRRKCCYYSFNSPDYSKFDVTLLYKLIRNLCPLLEPTKKWGNKPASNDLDVGDDIERIKDLRNTYFAHSELAELSNDEFNELWSDAKCMIQRCQLFLANKGCKTDYNQMLIDLERKTLTFVEYTSLKERSGAIYVYGESDVLCGETACFEAEITLEQDVYLPVSWDRVDGMVRKQIDVEDDKYKGSDGRKLFIHNVDKNDEARYQAVLSRNCDVKILSNKIYLRPKGDLPYLEELDATTKKGEINIHYAFKVSENSPIKDIKWTINKSELQVPCDKYRGGGEADNCFTILRPGEDDKGLYTCTVRNAVGSVSKSVKLDIPSAEIVSTSNSKVICGSDTRFDCIVSGYPSPVEVEWKHCPDGTEFVDIDTDMNTYLRSSSGLRSYSLLVMKATLNQEQYYRVVVSNNIGKCTSNTLFLQVTGSKPNISEVTCSLHGNSVKLKCDVFLYDESPALNDVYWTKNGVKIDIEKTNGKYSGIDINDPSLTINNVNHNDAGDYQLTAVNAVGETESELIVLGVPEVLLKTCVEKKDGSLWFTMTIKSVPVPHAVQWRIKENNSDTFEPINVNTAEYIGTSTSFPHPVLVIKHFKKLENCTFEIEVNNRIGEGKRVISGKIVQDELKGEQKTLGKFYADGGSDIPFSIWLSELADKFPKEKNDQLKFLIQLSCKIEDVTELENAKTAQDCFKLLLKEKILSPSDVITMQFLLKRTNCEELEKECIEYAKKENAMYFYEKPPENGYRNVRFHVVRYLQQFSKEDETKIRETVSKIVGCSIEEVRVHGYLYSASFFIVLSIKETYIERLYAMKQHDKERLSKLSIDYFKDDFNTVRLERTAGVKDKVRVIIDHPKGITESSKDLCIVDKGQNKLEPAANYIVFPKITKLDEKSRKQAIGTPATARSTSKKRHARGKQIVENEMVPILNPPLVSCGTDSPQTPTTSEVKDAEDKRTPSSISSAKVIVIPKITKLEEKSRKQALNTRATEVGYVEDTINKYTFKKRLARERQTVENEMIPILNPPRLSCVTNTQPLAVRDGLDKRKTSNHSPDMAEANTWTEYLYSQELQNLFGVFSVEVPDDRSKLSFAKGFFEASMLTEFVAEIRSLANRVVLCKRLKDENKKPGTVYVYEVVVKSIEDRIIIEKKDGRETDFFSEKNDDLVKVILIESSSQNVSKTKKMVYQEYMGDFRRETFYLQHVDEQFVEIAKLSAHRKFVSFKHVIESIRESIPLHSIENIVRDAVNRALSKEAITDLCNAAVIAESGNARSDPYYCRSGSTIERLKGELVKKTLDSVSTYLGSEITAEIQKHFESEIKSKFDPSLFHFNFGSASSVMVETLSVGAVALVTALSFPMAGLFIAVFGSLVTFFSAVNVNSPLWRRDVANEIYKHVSVKKQEVLNELASDMKKRCEITADQLTRVIRQLEDHIRRIHMIDQNALISEWEKPEILVHKEPEIVQEKLKMSIQDILQDERVLEHHESISRYIYGTKEGTKVFKVFLRYNDEKAKREIKENISEGIHPEFIVNSERFEEIRKNMASIIEMENSSPAVAEEEKNRLAQIINEQADYVYDNYSEVNGLRISNVRCVDGKFIHGPCIVIYCLDKLFVPSGESKLPESLGGYPCDIRENIIEFGALLGSSQVCGSVGFLVKSNIPSQIPVTGFLTAAHVVFNDIDSLYKEKALLSKCRHNKRCTFAQESHLIVKPAWIESADSEPIGEVVESFFGNYKPYGDDCPAFGIDAAFIKTYSPTQEVNENRRMQIVDENSLKYDGTTKVLKRGKETWDTEGFLISSSASIAVRRGNQHDSVYQFDNCFEIRSINEKEDFFTRGDSGFAVFVKEDGKLKPLGIAFAFSAEGSTYVCSIHHIVKIFNLSIYQEEENMETLDG